MTKKKKLTLMIILVLILIIYLYLNFNKSRFFYTKLNLSENSPIKIVADDPLFEMSSEEFEDYTQKPIENLTNDIINFRIIVKNYKGYPAIDILQEYYDKIGPSSMLNVLEENRFCHSEAHHLGRLIYNKTNNLVGSISICKTRCTAGCFHGVLMELFKQIFPNKIYESEKDLYDFFKNESNNLTSYFFDLCNQTEIAKHIVRGNCYHAIGHALLFLTDYNITNGLKFCKLLNDKAAIYYCATGAFMEYDIVYKDNVPENESFLFPCDTTNQFPAACFRYKIRRLFNQSTDPKKIAEICMMLPKSQRLGCFHGLGVAYYQYIFKNPQEIVSVCGNGDFEDKKMCIDGAIELISVFNKSISTLTCNYLESSLRVECSRANIYRTFNMEKPLELYFFEKQNGRE